MMVFLHLRVGLSLYVILKWTSIIGPSKPTASFRGEQLEWVQTIWPAPISPQGQAPRFPSGWCKIWFSWILQLCLGGPQVVGCTGNQGLGKSPI